MSFKIIGSGRGLPAQSLTAEDLDARFNLSSGTCRKKFGIEKRYYVSPSESVFTMATDAVNKALEQAQCTLDDIDLLLWASGTGHQVLPYNAAGLLAHNGWYSRIASLDINASCLSFLSALDYSHCAFLSGRYKRILIVSSEAASVGIPKDDPKIGTMFADGAASFVLEQCDESQGLLMSSFKTYAEGYNLCQIKGGGSGCHPTNSTIEQIRAGSYFEMQGKQLYKMVAKHMPSFFNEAFENTSVSVDDCAYIIPHQASALGLKHLNSLLSFNPEKVVNIFSRMGNQIAASLPMALHHLRSTKNDLDGNRVILIGSAAGLSLGVGVLEL